MFEFERNELVQNLRSKGITSDEVLNAFLRVERHEYVLPALQHLAYKDSALPIQKNQTISQPYTVAIMTQKLGLKKGAKVLEIGTGSGYQAAILFAMGMRVYTIERDPDLHKTTKKLHQRLGVTVMWQCGDGTIGWRQNAPFDGIIVTAGGPQVPESLKQQLNIGGRMVVPVGSKQHQSLHVVTRNSADDFNVEIIPDFLFVPLIGQEGWKTE